MKRLLLILNLLFITITLSAQYLTINKVPQETGGFNYYIDGVESIDGLELYEVNRIYFGFKIKRIVNCDFYRSNNSTATTIYTAAPYADSTAMIHFLADDVLIENTFIDEKENSPLYSVFWLQWYDEMMKK